MGINNIELKSFLREKEVDYLYHVNTVTTALTFLQNDGLMSRQEVENRKLKQTYQSSDGIDKYLGIYSDMFFDSDDIHCRAKQANFYGPVSFKYKLDVLDSLQNFEIKITKDNPIRWDKANTIDNYYYTDLQSLNAAYKKGDFEKHLVIKFIGLLPLKPYLEMITIDRPQRDLEIFNKARTTIEEILIEKQLPRLRVRECFNCKCQDYYNGLDAMKFDKNFKIL